MDATLKQMQQEKEASEHAASEAKQSEERAKGYADENLHKTVTFIDELLETNETNETNDKLWYMRAYSNSKLKHYENCIIDCNMAISLNPESYTAFNMRALAKNSLSDYSGALDDALKSLDINPDFEYPWRHLGNAYQGLQRYEEAIECYKKGINKLPNLYKLYSDRATAYRKMAELASTPAEEDNYIKLAEKDEKNADKKRDNLRAISHDSLKGIIEQA